MKGKRDNCDGTRPSCTQCQLTRRRCGGYKLDAVFVSYSAKPLSSRKPLVNPPNVDNAAHNTGQHDNTGIARPQGRPYQISQPIDTTSPNELTSIIVSRFLPKHKKNPFCFDTSTSQVCGAWVEMLPSIVSRAEPGELITAAARAFALVILDRGPEGKHKNFHSVRAYVATLEKLSSAMRSPENFFRIETAAAIVCLATVEFMLPEPDSNTLAHFGGLGALINMYSPGVFESGDFHVIFVGCRPVLLLQALTARRSTFLGRKEWLTVPFRKHPPSEMQTLLGDIAILPSILEQIDSLQDLAPQSSLQSAQDLKLMLSEVLVRLSKWDGHFEVTQKTMKSNNNNSHAEETVSDFWFLSLLAANVCIHVWAFQIICFTELAKLNKLSPSSDDISCSGPGAQAVWEEHKTRLSALATKICQSMEYMLQDEMLLYGPAAAMWPLAAAYSVLAADVEGNREEIERYWAFLSRIRERGFLSAPVSTMETRFGL
ncbi:hypothetical protein DL98DRAFT_607025 [Cadophora sp. DSE1049]|nr:hypothetical protein DL98DRAFT_607025 [Cadophora sp. DSE1049]